jgi:hypothetical protein
VWKALVRGYSERAGGAPIQNVTADVQDAAVALAVAVASASVR